MPPKTNPTSLRDTAGDEQAALATENRQTPEPGRISGGLEALIRRAGGPGRRSPPIHLWNPPHRGAIDMRIASDGSWHYTGTPIRREALVRLFASVLRKDDDEYVLVTPVEKVGIVVEDAPFLAVEMQVTQEDGEQRLTMRTNVGDVVTVDDKHPLRFEVERRTGGLKPYVLVRDRLEAKLARPLLYELAGIGAIESLDDGSYFGVWSNGRFFPMAPESAIADHLE